jgi:hypothetical protein
VSGPLAVELSWTQSAGAEVCIDRAAVVERVERTVGHRVFVPSGHADATLTGRIGPGPRGQGWLAVLEERSGDETTFRRELALAGSDCRRLDEAIVLVVALMVDSTQSATPLAIPAPPESVAVALGPDFALAYGMLPGAAIGFGLASDFTLPPLWPIALSTHGWPVSEAVQDGSGGRLWAWTLGVALCPVLASDRSWGFYGCVGVTGGSIDSSGTGLDVARSTTRAYAQAELRLGLRFRLAGPFFGALEGGSAVPFARDSYSYTQADGTVREVFQTAAVIPLLHARVEIRVP